MQCDQIGAFLNVLGDKFLYKVAKILDTFGAILKNIAVKEKLQWLIFGQLFTPTSGRTDDKAPRVFHLHFLLKSSR